MPEQSIQQPPHDWFVVADVGGTNARFAVLDPRRDELCHIVYYSVADHQVFANVLTQFCQEVAAQGLWAGKPLGACLAVAAPVEEGVLKFTNSSWEIDADAIAQQLHGAPVHVINDFAAVGYAALGLTESDWHQLGGGTGVPGQPIAVLGPGTGLGVCGVVRHGDTATVIAAEGGHADFAPVDAQEIAILDIMIRRFGRVSYERLLSGAGILSTYQALAELAQREPTHTRPEDVYAAAISGTDTLAMRTLHVFCRVLGAFAGNLALTLGARGGVFIAGGIAHKVLQIIKQSEFRNRFESKGRLRSFLTPIPVYVVTAADIGLRGAANYLAQVEQLPTLEGSSYELDQS